MFAAVLTRRFFAAALRAVLATVLAQPAAAPSKDDPAACGKGVGDCGTALADCVKKADQDIDAQCECYGPYQKCMDAVKGLQRDAGEDQLGHRQDRVRRDQQGDRQQLLRRQRVGSGCFGGRCACGYRCPPLLSKRALSPVREALGRSNSAPQLCAHSSALRRVLGWRSDETRRYDVKK